MIIESLSPLPAGVSLLNLERHEDSRGSLTEIFRDEWNTGVEPVQWNYVSSAANVLRGVHVHVTHSDYLVLLEGSMLLGLADLRKQGGAPRVSCVVMLRPAGPSAVLIPPGVAHGFYFPEKSLHIYGVSHTWNPADELGCNWSDPGLDLHWPFTSPAISERDATLPSLEALIKELPAGL